MAKEIDSVASTTSFTLTHFQLALSPAHTCLLPPSVDTAFPTHLLASCALLGHTLLQPGKHQDIDAVAGPSV